MRGFGKALLALGLTVLGYFWAVYDVGVTVRTPTVQIYGVEFGGDRYRVANLQRLNNRSTGVTGGGLLALAGVGLLAAAPKKPDSGA